jgi:beta-galactosidase
MPELDRRALLASSAALTAAAIVPPARAAAPVEARALPFAPAVDPREQLLFDTGWRFKLGHGADPAKDLNFGIDQGDFAKTGDFKFAKTGFDDAAWAPVQLPHDWAVELPFVRDDDAKGESHLRSHGYKPLGRAYPETSVGWYRRQFDVPASDARRRIWIEFDGAFRDVIVFVNGCFIGRNNNGYAPFRFDLTDFLAYGGANVITLRVDASFGDGWFYEGAGVYRHVWLLKTDPVHLTRWDSVVLSHLEDDTARLSLSTSVTNTAASPVRARVRWNILGPDGAVVAHAASEEALVPADGALPFAATATLTGPHLWSVGNPALYTAIAVVESEGKVCDGERIPFGIRNAVFDAQKGFLLNGQPVKIQGVCNHQDHAGVGAALPDRLQAFRLEVMQQMGCNAIRTSHNMPTPELIAACDRMGLMVMCETRQMSANAEGLAQLEVMIRRYRNSPSVILWSIGNEEWQLQDKLAEQGERIARTMVRRCHELDPTRQVSAAVNGGNEKGVSLPLDVIGFNYNPKLPEAFHAKHPDRPMVGSETSSAISTRGEYVTDAKRNTINSYDGVVPWGSTPEDWWSFYGSRNWEAGGFAWTGFDYRGEPTPYGWPSINSQFGIVDMCGFPKDYFHYYRAWWRKAPALHIFPHWNWPGKEGAQVDVWAYSNLEEVELLVNGRSLGRQKVPHLGHVQWKATYTPGAIEARGYRAGRLVLTERRETTGGPRTIRLSVDRPTLWADGEDVAMVSVEMLDAKGRHVPTAQQPIAFRVSGAGRLIGVGNGDPNCLESDKASERSLFNGYAQLIVQAGITPGPLTIEAMAKDSTSGLLGARQVVAVRPAQRRPAMA